MRFRNAFARGGICLALLLGLAARYSLATPSASVVSSFDLVRAGCEQGLVQDNSSRALVGCLVFIPSSVTSPSVPAAQAQGACLLGGNGVTGGEERGVWTSSHNVSSLRNALGNASFSIEMWLQQNSASQSRTADLVTIGPRLAPNSSLCANSFVFSQIPYKSTSSAHGYGQFRVTLCTLDAETSLTSASIISLKLPLNVSLISHLVVSFSSTPPLLSFYLQGALISSATINLFQRFGGPFDASMWSSSDVLKLLDAPFSSTWSGSIHKLAIYGAGLSAKDVTALFQQGLLNSDPETISSLVSIQENGEVGDHSQDPSFYSHAISSSQLVIIPLLAYDQDDLPSTPNNYLCPSVTAISTISSSPSSFVCTRGHSMMVQIISLPAAGTGQLYFLNGTAIAASPWQKLPFTIPKDNNFGLNFYGIRFRPALDVYSSSPDAITSTFSFRAVDGVTGKTSIANVSISISHVDKPPVVAHDGGSSSSTVIAGNIAILSNTLKGADVDSGIVQAAIVSLPVSGRLFVAFANGTISSSFPIVATPFFLPQGDYSLAYQYMGSQSKPLSTSGLLFQDHFFFALFDVEGRGSVPGQYNISVTTPVIAIPFPLPSSSSSNYYMAQEASKSNVALRGQDLSVALRNLSVRILSSPLHGSLFLTSGSTPAGSEVRAVPGTVLSRSFSHAQYGLGADVVYQGNKNFFSIPNKHFNSSLISQAKPDQFTFQVFSSTSSSSSTGQNLNGAAVSLPVMQYVSVVNVNDPTEISFTYSDEWAKSGMITIYAMSSTTSKSPIASRATVNGFSLLDLDLSTDIVRARVQSTQSGAKMSLNPDHVSRVDFNSATCFSLDSNGTAMCSGNGNMGEQLMEFLAVPHDIEAALNGLTYTSLVPNLVDIITVTIFDGQGGECLADTVNSQSIRKGCFARSAYFSVTILGYNGLEPGTEINSSSGGAVLSERNLYIGLAVAALCCMLGARCCWVRCYGKSNSEEEEDEEDDEENEEEDEEKGSGRRAHNQEDDEDSIECENESSQRRGARGDASRRASNKSSSSASRRRSSMTKLLQKQARNRRFSANSYNDDVEDDNESTSFVGLDDVDISYVDEHGNMGAEEKFARQGSPMSLSSPQYRDHKQAHIFQQVPVRARASATSSSRRSSFTLDRHILEQELSEKEKNDKKIHDAVKASPDEALANEATSKAKTAAAKAEVIQTQRKRLSSFFGPGLSLPPRTPSPAASSPDSRTFPFSNAYLQQNHKREQEQEQEQEWQPKERQPRTNKKAVARISIVAGAEMKNPQLQPPPSPANDEEGHGSPRVELWTTHIQQRTGRTYYYNSHTKLSSWKRPKNSG